MTSHSSFCIVRAILPITIKSKCYTLSKKQRWVFITLRWKAIESIEEREENVANKHFLLFPRFKLHLLSAMAFKLDQCKILLSL